jgi:hypothetical protein
MAISENQLDTWAKQAPKQQFVDTYGSIRTVLMSTNAPYHGKRAFEVHLQGSYGNETNVYGDSDVDIVVCTSDTFGYDLNDLAQNQQDLYRSSNGPNVQSACGPFKQEVIAWLSRYYGSPSVLPGKKAILLKGNGSRRDADILVCTEYRHYYRYAFAGDPSFDSGVRFYTTDGTSIVNYPKQHADNCTAKHQATNGWFKPTARIFKNMRNRMINRNIIGDDVAPSYFIEGMLCNVPNPNFGTSFQSTVANCLNWVRSANELNLMCANQLRPLVGDGSADAWPTSNFSSFITEAIKFWNAGG